MLDTPGTVLRPAVDADAERIAAIFTDEGYPAGPSAIIARLARFSGPDSHVVVADREGEVIGFIAFHALPRFEHDDVVVRILALVVDAGARERGAGFVEVTAGRHRPDARHLYESLGYDPSVTAYLRKRL